MSRTGIFMLGALLLLVSCDDDSVAPPDQPVPLSDLGPKLVVEPASGPVGTFFELHVELEEGASDRLADYELVVPWPFREYTMRIPADQSGRLQLPRVDHYDLSATLRAPEGSSEANIKLSVPVEVTAGAGDGSLDMVTIPAGTFLQGNTERRAFGGYTPQRTVHLSTYSIARTEVTNAAFVETLEWAVAQGRAEVFGHLVLSTDGILKSVVADIDNIDFLIYSGPTFTIQPGHELHPAQGIPWNGAAQWCNWQSERDGLEPAYTHTTIDINGMYELAYLECDFAKNGYRLPTEAEWEKAARGAEMLPDGVNPMPGRWYPWGDHDYHVNLSGGIGFYANLWQHMGDHTLPVGSFPAGRSPYGLDDMVGNVSEWVYDWFDYDYYQTDPVDVDPHGPDTFGIADEWLRKTWRSAPAYAWFMYIEAGCSSRFGYKYSDADLGMGFRVARSG